MICDNCNCKNECEWYESYKTIEKEILLGIGTDTPTGRALFHALIENPLNDCEYFESED